MKKKEEANNSLNAHQLGLKIIEAIQKGEGVEIISSLIEQGADVNAKNKDGFLPLLCSAERGNDMIIQLLINNGADVLKTADHGSSPLHCAVANGKYTTAKLLIANKANVNTHDIFGNTPLHSVLRQVNNEEDLESLVKLLLDNGANPCAQPNATDKGFSNYKFAPIHHAVKKGNLKVIKLLIDAGANCSALNSSRETPLHIAALNGNEKVVELLLVNGADVNVVTWGKETPLHYAAKNEKGYTKIASMIELFSKVKEALELEEVTNNLLNYEGAIELFQVMLTKKLNQLTTDNLQKLYKQKDIKDDFTFTSYKSCLIELVGNEGSELINKVFIDYFNLSAPFVNILRALKSYGVQDNNVKNTIFQETFKLLEAPLDHILIQLKACNELVATIAQQSDSKEAQECFHYIQKQYDEIEESNLPKFDGITVLNLDFDFEDNITVEVSNSNVMELKDNELTPPTQPVEGGVYVEFTGENSNFFIEF